MPQKANWGKAHALSKSVKFVASFSFYTQRISSCLSSGAHFSKAPKLLGPSSGVKISLYLENRELLSQQTPPSFCLLLS